MIRKCVSALILSVLLVPVPLAVSAKPKTYGSYMAEGGEPPPVRPDGTIVREGGIIVTDTAECRLVPLHRPAPDVTYRAGTNADGEAVPPADLPGSGAVRIPDEVTIGIQVPIVEFLGADVPPFLGDAEIDAGRVTVNTTTGELRYNGQRLDVPYAVICEEKAD